MKIALIDADSLCYISGDDLDQALDKVDKAIQSILETSQATHYKVFLEPKKNNVYRKKIFQTYKANRVGKPLPEFYNDIKDYIGSEWDAYGLNGYESDDVIISSYKKFKKEFPFSDVIVCALDKDYKTYPITFFDTYYQRFGQVSVIDEQEAEYNFLLQMITGDLSDNIKGIKGKGKKAGENALWLSKNRFLSVCRLYRKVYGSRWQKNFIKNYLQLRLVDNLRVDFELNQVI